MGTSCIDYAQKRLRASGLGPRAIYTALAYRANDVDGGCWCGARDIGRRAFGPPIVGGETWSTDPNDKPAANRWRNLEKHVARGIAELVNCGELIHFPQQGRNGVPFYLLTLGRSDDELRVAARSLIDRAKCAKDIRAPKPLIQFAGLADENPATQYPLSSTENPATERPLSEEKPGHLEPETRPFDAPKPGHGATKTRPFDALNPAMAHHQTDNRTSSSKPKSEPGIEPKADSSISNAAAEGPFEGAESLVALWRAVPPEIAIGYREVSQERQALRSAKDKSDADLDRSKQLFNREKALIDSSPELKAAVAAQMIADDEARRAERIAASDERGRRRAEASARLEELKTEAQALGLVDDKFAAVIAPSIEMRPETTVVAFGKALADVKSRNGSIGRPGGYFREALRRHGLAV